MSEIKELEQMWSQYRRKKRKPFFILLLLLILTLGYFFTSNSIIRWDLPSLNKDIVIDSQKIILNSGIKTLLTYSEQSNSVKLKNIQNEFIEIPILNEEVSKKVSFSRKKITLNILKTSSPTAYKDVEKRFFQTHDIDDALFLTKSYYKKEEYKKAKFWALEVNKLDATQDESFLIFIKSIIYLGNKNEGLSLLNTYIKKTNSDEAKALLYKIENNKL